MNENEGITRMNCSQFEEVLHDLDRPGTRGLALRDVALAHAEIVQPLRAVDDRRRIARFFAAGDCDARRLICKLPRGSKRICLRNSGCKMRRCRDGRCGDALRRISVAAAILLALGISLRHGSAPGGQPALGIPGPVR